MNACMKDSNATMARENKATGIFQKFLNIYDRIHLCFSVFSSMKQYTLPYCDLVK